MLPPPPFARIASALIALLSLTSCGGLIEHPPAGGPPLEQESGSTTTDASASADRVVILAPLEASAQDTTRTVASDGSVTTADAPAAAARPQELRRLQPRLPRRAVQRGRLPTCPGRSRLPAPLPNTLS
jgi:hypothetical protein